MPKSGKILHYDPTVPPSAPNSAAPEAELPEFTPSEALEELVRIILASEQDPVTQLAGYLIADDPTYLPDCDSARSLARRIGRDRLMEALIQPYVHTVRPVDPWDGVKLTFLNLHSTGSRRMKCPPTRSVLGLGNFDGVHRAHAVLLNETVKLARSLSEKQGEDVLAGVFCFIRPTLDFVLRGDGVSPVRVRGHLTTLRDKLKLFADAGLDFVCLCNFPDIRNHNPEDFIRLLQKTCNAVGVACGFNYFFGKNASGNPAHLLHAFGHENVFIQPEMAVEGMTVSSSRIRNCISNGDMETAERLLGRPYFLESAVVHGKRLGRTIGFPTANQYFPTERAIPSRGVYAVLCHTPYGVFPGVSNVGIRPTTDAHGRVNCETHIIGIKEDLYGRRIRIDFLTKLREEKRFADMETLISAIREDAEAAEAYVRSRGLI